MSLVIAFSGENYQIWFSDGLTIELTEKDGQTSSNTTVKIVRHPHQNILYGWSGDKYDAEFVINNFINRQNFIEKDDFINEFALDCARINFESQNYSLRNNKVYSSTGFILGGFWGIHKFLSIVTPDGKVLPRKQTAILGHDSQLAYSFLSEHIKSANLKINNVFKIIIDVFEEVASCSRYVNKIIFPFAVCPHKLFNLTAINLFNGTLKEKGIEKHFEELNRLMKDLDS